MAEYKTQHEIIIRKVAIDAEIAKLKAEKKALAEKENAMVQAELAARKPSSRGQQRVSL